MPAARAGAPTPPTHSRVRRYVRAAIAGIVLAPGPVAVTRGTVFTWNDSTGNWSDPARWVSGAAPTGSDAADVLVFGGDIAAPYVATNDVVASPFLLGGLRLQMADGGGGNFHTING